MVSNLELRLKEKTTEAESYLKSLETREEAYFVIKRAHDGLANSLKQASMRPVAELIELMAQSDEDDDDEGVDEPKKVKKLPCMPMRKGAGNWGPFPEAQWQAMLIVAVQMQQQQGGSNPTRRVINYPPVSVDVAPEGYFVLPFCMWDPVKIHGVKNPVCPECKCPMRPCGWSKDGPRIAYTLASVVLVLAKQYRCGNGRPNSGCGIAILASEDKLLKMWPPAVTTSFPFLVGKKRLVETRLASQWVFRYTSSNTSYTNIAEEYTATLAEDLYTRCTQYFQRLTLWSVWTPNRKSSLLDPSQTTMHDHGDRTGAALVMAMLQDKELPEVFQGPSHDTVRHFIDKAAERNAFLQDAAMAAQTTQDTMKGDHTFKLAALCQNALGTPFTAHHSIMGDSAILLSVVFAKDESIAALKEQHEELKVRHLQRGMPPPLVYAVDKCCSFKQLSKQLSYTEDEVNGLIEAAVQNGDSPASVAELKKRLSKETHRQQDLMHLVGRMMTACGFMTPFKTAFMRHYRAIFWELTDSADRDRHWTKVPQNRRRIWEKAELEKRMLVFKQEWCQSESCNDKMRHQLDLATTHAAMGCVSDVPGVRYCWTDKCGAVHTNRGTSIVECYHKELNRVRKNATISVQTMAILTRNVCARWNAARLVLIGARDFLTPDMRTLGLLREAIATFSGSQALFRDAYLPPMEISHLAFKFFNEYQHKSFTITPEHTVQLQNEALMPILNARFAEHKEMAIDASIVTLGEPMPLPRSLQCNTLAVTTNEVKSNMWFCDDTLSDTASCFDALVHACNFATQQDFDAATLLEGLKTHVLEFKATYDSIFGLSSVKLMEDAANQLPNVVCTTAITENRLILTFVLRAIANLFGVPIVLFKKHNEAFLVDVITPCIFLDGLPDYVTVMLFAVSGTANLKHCLMQRAVTIIPGSHLDSLEACAPECGSTQACVVDMNIGAQGKRAADNHTGGAMADHMVQTPHKTAIINPNQKNGGTKDFWSEYETKVLLSYVNRCLVKTVGAKGESIQFRVHTMDAFWKNAVTAQAVDAPPDKKLNARTTANLRSKWDSCVKAKFYKACVEKIMKTNDTDILTVDIMDESLGDTPVKRARRSDTEMESQSKEPRTESKAKEQTGAKETTNGEEQTSDGIPSDNVLKDFLRGKTKDTSAEDFESINCRSLRVEMEKHFRLSENSLKEKATLIRKFLDDLVNEMCVGPSTLQVTRVDGGGQVSALYT